MRRQNAWRGWSLAAPLDMSMESLLLFFKPSVIRTCLKSLLGIWVFRYLLDLSWLQKRHTLCLPEVPGTKITGLKQWANSWNCFSYPFWFSNNTLYCLLVDWGRSAEKKTVNSSVSGTQSHHLKVLQTKTPRSLHSAGRQYVWNLFCTQGVAQHFIFAVGSPLLGIAHSARAGLN